MKRSAETSREAELVVPNAVGVPKKAAPLYLSIRSCIGQKIANGALAEGAVIKEGPLASVFGVSRAPVRRALQMLEKEDFIRPADGQGFVIGRCAEGVNVSVQELRSLFLDQSEPKIVREAAWESIFDSILQDVSNCLPFGTFRVSETVACEHLAIGRTALRDGLSKLRDQGFLQKSMRSHWIAGPLTARDVHEAFEIRRLMEPAAFVQSVAYIEKATIRKMRVRVASALSNLDAPLPEDIESIENDLHRVLLDKAKNRRLLEAIDRNQFPFIVGRIFRRNFGLKPDQSALEDHVHILDQLLKGHIDVARTMLETHLEKAERNTLAKLRVLSVLPKPKTAPYLITVH